jgi:cobalt-precorrin-5B (C1)-methyltransferase
MEELNLIDEFHQALCEKVIETLRGRYPDQFNLRVLVCDFEGVKLAEAADVLS